MGHFCRKEISDGASETLSHNWGPFLFPFIFRESGCDISRAIQRYCNSIPGVEGRKVFLPISTGSSQFSNAAAVAAMPSLRGMLLQNERTTPIVARRLSRGISECYICQAKWLVSFM